jgi:hypothetical protein
VVAESVWAAMRTTMEQVHRHAIFTRVPHR